MPRPKKIQPEAEAAPLLRILSKYARDPIENIDFPGFRKMVS
jgi:hypothetical protein